MNAAEAKRLTDHVRTKSERIEPYLAMVHARIKKAAEDGRSSASFRFVDLSRDISVQTQVQLRQALAAEGYEIGDGEPGGSAIVVSW